jgi:uncharacterized protein DUF4389
MTQANLDAHPIDLIVHDDLRRNRLTVFFRLLLAIPQVIWIWLWSIAAVFAVVVAWIMALVTGSVPEGLHSFLARYLRAGTHLYSYVLLLADPWPPFGGAEGTYPLDLRVDPPEPQSRLTVLFRLVLAIPAFLLSYVFRVVNQLLAFLGWFYCLALGRMHEGMRDVSAWMLRYEVQTYAYAILLTGRYPSLAGGPAV